MLYVPRTKKNQGRLVRQLENEEDIFSPSAFHIRMKPYGTLIFGNSYSPVHCIAVPDLSLSSILPGLQDYAMQPSSSWIHQSPPSSTILINAAQ